MAHTTTPNTFGAGIGGGNLGTPSAGFDNLTFAFEALKKTVDATHAFLKETPGKGHTITETGPEGTTAARTAYQNSFGAL